MRNANGTTDAAICFAGDAGGAGLPGAAAVAGIEAAYPNLVRVPVALASFDALAFTNGRDLPLRAWPLFHYVYKAHAAVIPALTQALQEMQRSGHLAARQANFAKRLPQARRGLSSE